MSLALSTASLPLLPSFRRQQLLLEFATLKHHCPDGIYLTPNANDPASWTGVYFVREGPYSSALLRFEILFPPSYPEAAPLVIFSTEIFHPLLVPLTTYAYSPGATDPTATYSASETERLPPGALSLRLGFPHWFPTAGRGRTTVRVGEGQNDRSQQEQEADAEENDSKKLTLNVDHNDSSIVRLLKYIKSAFESSIFLDEICLEDAGNANAWHAWRSYRGLPKQTTRPESPAGTRSGRTGLSPRNPADWDWGGVWEARVQSGIAESTSDALLFSSKNLRGGISANDPIRFVKLDDEKLAGVQADMLRMHGFSVSDG